MIVKKTTISQPDGFAEEASERISEQQAGYLELPGAVKDSECTKVDVEGGISLDRGCCNIYDFDEAREKRFACGSCEYRKQ